MSKTNGEKRINSVSSYIEEVFKLRKTKTAELSDANYWFFRGQKNSEWGMCPNVFRGDALYSEYSVIQQAMRQRPYDFRECKSSFEVLTKLQHYGLGTRLLDVTLNPLVALFFASEEFEDFEYGKDGRGKKVKKDGKIVYRYSYGHKLDELGVRIACRLPFIELREDASLDVFVDQLKRDGIISADECLFLKSNEYEGLIHTIQRNSYVMASYSNDRLKRQSGAFIVPTAILILPNGKDIGSSLIRKASRPLDSEFDEDYFIIPHEKKKSIREELDFLNINEATLFPELEHQLIYLQNKKTIVSGTVEKYQEYIKPIITEEEEEEKSIATSAVVPHPDVSRIIDKNLAAGDTSKEQVQQIIADGISTIDWWLKEAITSRMRRDITRVLQERMSARQSKATASEIVEDLIDPAYGLPEE